MQVTALMVLGTLLVQFAWLLVLPPFEGMDEFDHAHHASAVGHGQFRSDLGPAENGRGVLVAADGSVVDAAAEVCASYEFTEPDNCFPVSDAGGELVVVASASGIYAPTYYLTVGWTTQFLDGYSALYGMRALSMLLCAIAFGVATWVVTGWCRSGWPMAALVLTMTPTAIYSTVVVAPNGLEMFVALSLWAALLGLADDDPPRQPHSLLAVVTLTGSLLAWLRPLGPVWLFLVIASWLILLGRRRFMMLVRSSPKFMVLGMGVIATAAGTSMAWVLANPSVDEGHPPVENVDRLGRTFSQIPLWFLQNISGVPYRDLPAPLIVYALGFATLALFIILGLRARGRAAAATCFILVSSIAFGAWYTWSRLPTAGTLWQGRYMWCLAVGAILIAGWALERHRQPSVTPLVAVFGLVSVVVCQLVVLDFVLDFEISRSPLSGESAWFDAPFLVVAAIAGVGMGLWFWAVQRAQVMVPKIPSVTRPATDEGASVS